MGKALTRFFHTEASSGVAIVAAAIAALVIVNSGGDSWYLSLSHTDISIKIGSFEFFSGDLTHFVSDVGMTIFFLVVGLEMKRELTNGELRNWSMSKVPVFGAIGGMVVPVAIFLLIASGDVSDGWAIPMATDIALAIGVLSLFGSRIPTSVRIFLLTLAVVDDLGAVLVIAFFYSTGVTISGVVAALVVGVSYLIFRKLDIRSPVVYVLLGFALWESFYHAGIHPTIAGVIIGLLTPAIARRSSERIDVSSLNDLSTTKAARESVAIAKETVPVVDWLEGILHPWSSFLVVPAFAFFNAGVNLNNVSVTDAMSSSLGVAIGAGLIVGKMAGILVGSMAAIKLFGGNLPSLMTNRHLVTIGALGGIGFTVSLFVTESAFGDYGSAADTARTAILVTSTAAALIAALLAGLGRQAATD